MDGKFRRKKRKVCQSKHSRQPIKSLTNVVLVILLDDKIKVKTEIAMVIKRLIEEWTNVHGTKIVIFYDKYETFDHIYSQSGESRESMA